MRRTAILSVILLSAATLAIGFSPASAQPRPGLAQDCCGTPAAWTTGNKDALGTSTTPGSKVWYTVANGVLSEVFYPRADVPNTQDTQYVVTDGSTFVDLERDATEHAVTMPDERSLEYTVTNTAKSGKYRITSSYVTDPDRDSLMVRTRFQSLDGGTYKLFLHANPSMAGGGANDDLWWDAGSGALMASGTENLFGQTTTITSAMRVSSGFSAHSNGYAGAGSDCLVDIRADRQLSNSFDGLARPGNGVHCGQIDVGADTEFTVALGYGDSAGTAQAAAGGSLDAGFGAVQGKYRAGWNAHVGSLKPAPASVSGDAELRKAYHVAAMALRAAEDKTHPGASVASLSTPWGEVVNGDTLNDGYHRVWGRDLYHQATGLIAAGDTAQARRMAEFMWRRQWIGTPTPGDGTTYPAGSFPRYSPVSGIEGATPHQLGCCEQLDQNAFAIVLASLTGLTDSGTYDKIKVTAEHIRTTGPATTERWEEQHGLSPSSVAAQIAGLRAAADIARRNGDDASASTWESTANAWRGNLEPQTVTTSGHWPGGRYYERLDRSGNPNDDDQICFQEGCFFERDVVDFGFLELVRLGVLPADDPTVAASVRPTAAAHDGNAPLQVTLPTGEVYFHRYIHDNYGESTVDCQGWPANGQQRFGRLWPVLSGERGEYELANGRPAEVYLRSMARSANAGGFVPEQVWDRADVSCFGLGRPTNSASPLMWAEGQYLRLAQAMSGDAPRVGGR
ncbi:glucoamylase [Herbihabitans rhizosphaerae]|uniref:Glucoamylase n=1 Tax=Herbihabitans rhizosphaerae TaxID=1872711 RepID=A0A4Q7KJA1_9PSEU|nr:glycoside hydrolase family 15 protein [Herbihabitans rhizosphaerae]RZS34315.1 glucoamylase [Herbihabitans rhizosphaerae]